MMATQAHALGYGVNTTATRVLFRSPYSTQQTEVTKVKWKDVLATSYIVLKQACVYLDDLLFVGGEQDSGEDQIVFLGH